MIWVYNSLYMVQPDELGQELVFGKPKTEVSTQGLHFIFWPVETVEIVPTACSASSSAPTPPAATAPTPT